MTRERREERARGRAVAQKGVVGFGLSKVSFAGGGGQEGRAREAVCLSVYVNGWFAVIE